MLSFETGKLIADHYKVVRTIGAGGMGAVYLASDEKIKNFFIALKVLYPGLLKTPASRERFRNEITALLKINNPNVVRAFEYFDYEEMQGYSMEYVDGGDLFELMQHGPISSSETIGILKQIANGLMAVHKEGIVHRDLKPENILITADKVVKISDFGVARLREAATLTKEGLMVGTPKYIPPEYVEVGESDARGDLYAIGVIAYEMVAGHPPFKEHTNTSMLVLERFKSPHEPLSKTAPTCPSSLVRIIEKAMTVQVMRRYQNASELFTDLSLAEQGKEPQFAYKQQRSFHVAWWRRRRRKPSQDIQALPSTSVKRGRWKLRFAVACVFCVCVLHEVWQVGMTFLVLNPLLKGVTGFKISVMLRVMVSVVFPAVALSLVQLAFSFRRLFHCVCMLLRKDHGKYVMNWTLNALFVVFLLLLSDYITGQGRFLSAAGAAKFWWYPVALIGVGIYGTFLRRFEKRVGTEKP